MFHDEEGKSSTEVGAAWEHERGLSIVIKRGMAIAGKNIFAFRITDEDRKKQGKGKTGNPDADDIPF
jgi:hypothetical protein